MRKGQSEKSGYKWRRKKGGGSSVHEIAAAKEGALKASKSPKLLKRKG